jgi:hypothetical protein
MTVSSHNQTVRRQTPVRTREGSYAWFLLGGLVVLVALVVVAERAGLPEGMAQTAVVVLLAVFCISILSVARTAEESVFLGRIPGGNPALSGVVLGILLTGAGLALLRPETVGAATAVVAGQCAGLVLAHGVARWQVHEAGQAGGKPVIAILSGLLETTAGVALSAACLSVIIASMAPAFASAGMPVSGTTLSLMVVCLPAFAVAAGGARACFALLTGLASLVVAGYGIMLAAGILGLGSLPLPWFSETSTLAAIAEAKTRWFQTPVHPVQLISWPSLPDVLTAGHRIWFFGSAAMAFSLALLLAPAIPLRRRRIVVPALSAVILLPLAMIATAGYAIETAGFQFIGSSVQRPPAGLLEAARNGFVTLCNAAPGTAEALRVACGASPREPMSLAWDQIRIAPSFLSGGLTAALAYPAALAFLTRVAEPLVLLSGLVAGFWIAARGLGLRVLAREKMAPGLASLRLGLVRLAGLLLTVCLTVAVALVTVPVTGLWLLTAITAFSGVLITFVANRSGNQAAAGAPTDNDAATAAGKRRKKPALAAGDAV